MTIDNLIKWLDEGSDIEFKFKGKDFSITWAQAGDKDVISFCEFYQPCQDASSYEELLNLQWNGESLQDIWESLSVEDVWH